VANPCHGVPGGIEGGWAGVVKEEEEEEFFNHYKNDHHYVCLRACCIREDRLHLSNCGVAILPLCGSGF